MMPAPFTPEELTSGVASVLAEGGLFTIAPRAIDGVDYPNVFALSAAASLRDLLAMKSVEHAAREFIVYGDERYTVADVWGRAMRFANWLVGTKNVRAGDRVAIAMRNYPEWPIAFLGIVASGATVVPLNAWWQEDELVDGVARASARIVVCDAKRASALSGLRRKGSIEIVSAREACEGADIALEAIMADEALPKDAPPIAIDPESDFCLLYTSGSTGKPKGALLTHRSTVNALLSWSFTLTVASRLRPDFPFTPEKPAVLLALPLFHVTALHSTLILSWMIGRKTVFMYKWEAEEAVRLIKAEAITNFVGVPTMAHELTAVASPADVATLKDVITGGAKRPATHVLEQHAKLPEVGVSSGYGLTETNSLIAHITMADFIAHPGAAGRAIPPINEIATFAEDGTRLPPGAEGEICVKSPVTFRGYDNDPEATANAFHPGGWFRTGDIGMIDPSGFIHILDRAKDLIIRGGENVSCPEVEDAILSFPGIDEAAAFSVPDEKYGEIVGAAFFSRTGKIDLAALNRHLCTKLAAFKVPERVWVSPQQLPRGGTGKVDKRQIRMIALAHPAHWSPGA